MKAILNALTENPDPMYLPENNLHLPDENINAFLSVLPKNITTLDLSTDFQQLNKQASDILLNTYIIQVDGLPQNTPEQLLQILKTVKNFQKNIHVKNAAEEVIRTISESPGKKSAEHTAALIHATFSPYSGRPQSFGRRSTDSPVDRRHSLYGRRQCRDRPRSCRCISGYWRGNNAFQRSTETQTCRTGAQGACSVCGFVRTQTAVNLKDFTEKLIQLCLCLQKRCIFD